MPELALLGDRSAAVRMVPGTIRINGRRLRFAISDNEKAHGPAGPGSPPIWAFNIHGFFAGGGMYWRESARLAQELGWRVVNPSLPGFGGSDPLEWGDISMETIAHQIQLLIEHLDAGPVVLLGHSMGGAVAVEYASKHRDNVLGMIYRDGIATPSWKHRHSLLANLTSAFLPDSAPFLDLLVAITLDAPDLLVGRLTSTVRSVLPDVRRNIRSIGHTLPVGSMLMSVDMRQQVAQMARARLPILTEWGCFDRVAPASTAEEFADWSRTEVQWLPGGHSWMLARPQGQADVLRHLESGQRFQHQVEDRWRRLHEIEPALRIIS